MSGIESYATYVPQYRLTAAEVSKVWPGIATGIKSRSVAGCDEDVISMSTEVALAALSKAGLDGAQLSGIFLATTSSPYDLKSAAAVVADLLGAPQSCWTVDFGAGTQAGLSALVMALSIGLDRPVLVIGADALKGEPGDPAELSFGAGAAAFIVSPSGSVAHLGGVLPQYSSYTYIWRTPTQRYLSRHDDPRFERHAGFFAQADQTLRRALEQAGGRVDKLAIHLPDAQQHSGIMRGLKLDSSQIAGVDFVRTCGDTGCANSLINLTLALDAAKPDERIIAMSYGSGGGTVSCLINVGDGVQPRVDDVRTRKSVDISYDTYAKYVGILPIKGLPEPVSSYVAAPGWERGKRMEIGLRGLVCKNCGCLNFPHRYYCLDCRGQQFEEVPLPRTGSIVTYNLQYVVAVSPEEAPIPVANVALDGAKKEGYGGKVAAMMTDYDPEAVEIGTRVELVPRRCGVELGLVRYGYKWRPILEEK